MDSPISADSVDCPESRDARDRAAFRIQVAAVVAQQAALTEQEIELGDVHDLILHRVDELLGDLRQAEDRLAIREAGLRDREIHLLDMGRECAESAGELRERLMELGDKRRLLLLVADGLAGAEQQIERLHDSLARMSRLVEPTPTLRAYAA
jgi:hypothetical protein